MDIEEKITEGKLKELVPKVLAAQFRKAKSPAQRADFLYELDAYRLAEKKKVDQVDKFQNALEEWFIQNLPTKDATGIAGKVGRVGIERKEIPSVEDWTKLYAHVKKTGAFELLGKRLITIISSRVPESPVC